MISAKEAVKAAIEYLGDLYADERLEDVLVEEIEPDEQKAHWRVILGYYRLTSQPSLQQVLGQRTREFKVFDVDGETGSVVSMKIVNV